MPCTQCHYACGVGVGVVVAVFVVRAVSRLY